MAVADITIADFKAYHTRGFDYYPGTGCSKDFVTDADIQKAFDVSKLNFNESLFASAAAIKTAFLILAAHHLCVDLQTSAQGVNSVGYAPVASRGVGPVSESYALPESLVNNPVFSQYLVTRYGQQYLGIIRPLLIGNVQVYEGYTTP